MKPPNDSPPLVQKIGATSIAEIEKLIEQLQETRNFLQSEADRIERETARYIKLTDSALVSVRFIFDTLAGWRQAGHPCANSSPRPKAGRTARRVAERSKRKAPLRSGREVDGVRHLKAPVSPFTPMHNAAFGSGRRGRRLGPKRSPASTYGR